MRFAPFALPFALLLAACSGDEPTPAPSGSELVTDTPSAEPTDDDPEVRIVPATASSSPDGNDRAVKQESDYYDFSYSFPEAAASSPVLRKWFEDDIDAKRDHLIAAARKARDAAIAARIPFRRRVLLTKWSTIAEVPGFASLSAFAYAFDGGAHGMTTFRSFVWDKKAVARRPTLTLFASSRALAKAIRAPFCAELDRMRGKKRGQPVDAASKAEFEACIEPLGEGTVALASSDDLHFDGLTVLVPPGAAGPYVEGSYEVKLPVTAAVIAAIRPRFRKAFAVAPASPNAT